MNTASAGGRTSDRMMTSIPPQRQKLHRALLLIGMLLSVPLAGYALYKVTLGRSPLAGENTHDFGELIVVDSFAAAEHTFRLTNRTAEPITITDVVPSCGCLDPPPKLSTDVVRPGEVLEVLTTVTVTGSGTKRARVSLVMEDHGSRTLYVTAHGRNKQQLDLGRIVPVAFEQPGGMPTFVVFAEIWPEDGPDPSLTLRPPPGVEARITEWSQQKAANRRLGRPARWMAKIEVHPEDPAAAQDQTLVVELNPQQTLEIPLTPIPRTIRRPPGPPPTPGTGPDAPASDQP